MHAQHINLFMHLFLPLILSPEWLILKKMAITPLKRLKMNWLSRTGQVFGWFWGGGGPVFLTFLFGAVFFQKITFLDLRNFQNYCFFIFRGPGENLLNYSSFFFAFTTVGPICPAQPPCGHAVNHFSPAVSPCSPAVTPFCPAVVPCSPAMSLSAQEWVPAVDPCSGQTQCMFQLDNLYSPRGPRCENLIKKFLMPQQSHIRSCGSRTYLFTFCRTGGLQWWVKTNVICS